MQSQKEKYGLAAGFRGRIIVHILNNSLNKQSVKNKTQNRETKSALVLTEQNQLKTCCSEIRAIYGDLSIQRGTEFYEEARQMYDAKLANAALGS